MLNDYIIEGALVPAIGAVGAALSAGERQFNFNMIMGLFVKDFYYTSEESAEKIDALLEGYFQAVLKMSSNYETGNSKNTRNPVFTSLRAFIENCSNEDTLKGQLLSYRSWF